MSGVADHETSQSGGYALVAPAALLFLGILLVPLTMTLILSFNEWGQYRGIHE